MSSRVPTTAARPGGRRPALGLLGYGLVAATSHLLWAAADGRPPPWDRAIHLENALRARELLRTGAWAGLLDLSDFYPPLAYWAAGLLHLVLGPSPLVALVVTQVALAAVVLATYRLGLRVLDSPAAAVAAGLTVAAYTELFLESRVFMLDLPLTALVTLAALAGLRAEGFRHRGWALAFGSLAGLTLLVKWTAVLFTVPIGVALWTSGGARDPGGRARRARAALLPLAAMLAVALPWYAIHPGLPASLLARGIRGTTESVRGLDPAAAWSYYVGGLPWQLGPPFAALLAVGLFFARRCRAHGLLLAWVLIPLVCFTLLPNKDYRFTMPLFPALAVLGVAWLPGLAPPWPARAVAALALVVLAHGAWLGWGWPAPEWARGRMERRLLFPAFPPLPEHWPIAEILDAVARDRSAASAPATLSVVPDFIYLSRPTVSYEAVRRALPIRVTRAWSGPPLAIDYGLTKGGDQGPAHTTREARALTRRIEAGDPALAPLLTRLGRWPLPDGTEATLYRVAPAPVPGLTTAAVRARLRTLPSESLARVVQAPEGLWAEVEPLSEAASATGRFRRLVLGADEAVVGDFRRKPVGVRVHAVEVTLDDVQIDPYALIERGRIEVLRAGRLTLRRATVTAADLEAALEDLVPWVRSPAVTIGGGRLVLTGGLGPVSGRVTVRAEPGPAGNALFGLRVETAALGPVPVPAGLLGRVLRALDPAGRLASGPVPVAVPPIVLEGALLRLGSPG